MFFQNSVINHKTVTDNLLNIIANMRDKSTNIKTGFLFCPRCGLRKPKSEIQNYYGGHCPYCGYSMIDEYYIPYNSRKSELLLFPCQIGSDMMQQIYFQNQLSDNSI